MKVLVDTSVWSRVLRRGRPEKRLTDSLATLIDEGRVLMIGPVRQELLSGVRARSQFETLRDHLRAFPDLPLATHHYERAAECFNSCRSRGIQGSHVDFLICAVALTEGAEVFTSDGDFEHYADHLGFNLYSA